MEVGEMPIPFANEAGLVLLVVSCGLTIVKLIGAIGDWRRGWRFQMVRKLHTLGTCVYLIGGGLKLAEWGPEWARFHLCDLGFPFVVALIICARREPSFWVGAESPVEKEQAALKVGQWWRFGMALALGLSIAYEVVSGALVAYLNSKGQQGLAIGAFDVIDIACYTVGAALGYALWTLWIRDSRVLLEQAQAEAAMPKPKRPKPAGDKSSRKRRNGRPGGRH